jgi:hypothetical protein
MDEEAYQEEEDIIWNGTYDIKPNTLSFTM